MLILKANKSDYTIPKAYMIFPIPVPFCKLLEPVIVAYQESFLLLDSTHYRSKEHYSSKQTVINLIFFVVIENI